MKNIIYFAMIISLLLFSCKKEHKSTNDGTLHNVTFTVKGFTQTTTPFNVTGNKHIVTDAIKSDATDTLGGKTYIEYSVYDASGNYIHSITESSDQSNYGTITDNLTAGNYTVNIAAYPSIADFQADYNPYYITGNANPLNSAVIAYSDGRTPFIDTFSKTFGITVSATSAINQSVTLNRIDGQLQVVITDSLPSNAASLQVTVSKGYLEYYIATSAPDTINHNGALTFYTNENTPLAGKINFALSAIMLNTVNPFEVNIQCLDASKNILAEKAVNNVYCQVNKTTILSGNLFGTQTGNSANNFTVSVNSAWNPVEDTIQFSSIKRTINRVNR